MSQPLGGKPVPIISIKQDASQANSKSSSFIISNRRSSGGNDFPDSINEKPFQQQTFDEGRHLLQIQQMAPSGSPYGHSPQGGGAPLLQSKSDILRNDSPGKQYDRFTKYALPQRSFMNDKDSLMSSGNDEDDLQARFLTRPNPTRDGTDSKFPPPPASHSHEPHLESASYTDRLQQLEQSHMDSQLSIEELASQVTKQRKMEQKRISQQYGEAEIQDSVLGLGGATNQEFNLIDPQVRSGDSRISESNASNLKSVTDDSSVRHVGPMDNSFIDPNRLNARSPTQLQLTNQFNERSMIQVFKQGLQARIQDKMQELLLEGTIQKKQMEKSQKKNKAVIKSPPSDTSDPEEKKYGHFEYPTYSTTQTLTTSNSQVIIDFFQHFEIEKMLTLKCIVVVCFKLRNQKFLLKQLPEQAIAIQEFVNTEVKRENFRSERKLNLDFQLDFLELIDPWLNVPPQVPKQSLTQCYGLIRLKENYYIISNLVEDYSVLSASASKGPNKAGISKSKDQTNSLNSIESAGVIFEGGNSGIEERYKMAKNTYQLISSFQLGNLSGHAQIPDFYVIFLIRYIINVSDALAHSHEHGLVHGNFNLGKVVAQRFQTSINQIVQKAHKLTNMSPADLKDMFDLYNFIVVNFEPWSVERLMAKHTSSDSLFKEILKMKGFGIDRKEYLQIAKVQDLQAFGNSIIEILVGKSTEQADITDTDRKTFKILNSSKLEQGEITISDRFDLNVSAEAKQRISISSQIDPVKLKEEINQLGREHSKLSGTKDSTLKSFSGGITLDSIPLNWAKRPQILQLLNILKLCYGPYEFNNNFKTLDTADMFRKINKIAHELYAQFSGEPIRHDNIRQNDQMKKTFKMRISDEQHRRLRSSVENNQGIMMFLSISEDTHKEQRLKIIDFVRQKFDKALQITPDNGSALLNRVLLSWQIGEVKDEDLNYYIKHTLANHDYHAAYLMFLLFKKRVHCGKIDSKEAFKCIQAVESDWEKASNLAKYLYASPEFSEFRERNKLQSGYKEKVSSKDLLGHHVGLIKTHTLKSSDKLRYVYKQNSEPGTNHKIDLKDPNFNPYHLFISNNDSFVGVIGTNSIILVDSRNGKQISKLNLPSWDYSNDRRNETGDSDSYDDQALTTSMQRYSSQTKTHEKVETSHEITETSGIRTTDIHTRGHNLMGGDSHTQGHITIREGDDSNVQVGKLPAQGRNPTADTFSEGGEPHQEEDIPSNNQGSMNPGSMNQGSMNQGSMSQVPKMQKDSSTVIGIGAPHPNSGQTTQIQSQISMLNSRHTQQPTVQGSLPENMDRIFGLESTMNSGINSAVVSQMQSREEINRREQVEAHVSQSITELQNMTSQGFKISQSLNQGKDLAAPQHHNETFGVGEVTGKPSTLGRGENSILFQNQRDLESRGTKIFGTSAFSKGIGASKLQDALNSQMKANIQRMKEEAMKEKEAVYKEIPAKWMGNVRNNGKMLALYDTAQHARNQVYKNKMNLGEVLYVYNILMSKGSSSPNATALNMKKLLDDNEVLSFGFDDFNESFSTICVQAKDLMIYEIDFVNQTLQRKISANRTNVMMRSIFFNPEHRQKYLGLFQPVKELIQFQESLGNEVLLPKRNDKVFAVRVKDSNLIQYYSVRLRQVIRQFQIIKDDIYFDDRDHEEEDPVLASLQNKEETQINLNVLQRQSTHIAMKQRQRKKEIENFKPGLFLQGFKYSERIPNYENYLEDRHMEVVKANMANQMKAELKRMQEDMHAQVIADRKKQNEVKLIEISPLGRMLACVIGNDLFIRVVNLQVQSASDMINKRSGHQIMNSFMPIYLDLDYYKGNKEVEQLEKQAEDGEASRSELKVIALQSESKLRKSMLIFQELLSNNIQCQKDLNQGYYQFLIDVPAIRQKDEYIKKIDIRDVQAIKKISPGTVDRICHSYSNLKKFQGSLYQKNEKMFEVSQFINAILFNPQLLFDCPLRLKKRNDKISSCLKLLREIQSLDPLQIKKQRLFGIQKMLTFEEIKFGRSFELIKSFNCSSNLDVFLCALILNRKLQVYDFVSNEILFEMQIPSVGGYKLKQGFPTKLNYQSIIFVDSDQIIAIQDGKNTLQLINISAQQEAYRQMNIKAKSNDITIKIEKPIGEGIDIVDNFGIDADQEDEKHSDDSEPLAAGTITAKTLEFDQPIEAVFTSRASTQYGYLAVVGKMKFTIFYIYDDNVGGSDFQIVWSKDYRFDKHIRTMGQIISLDFEDRCVTFITGTQMGWICVWDLPEKRMLRRVQLINPVTRCLEACHMIRNLRLEKAFLSYDAVTKNLFLVTTNIRLSRPEHLTETDPEQVSMKKGPSIDKSKAGTDAMGQNYTISTGRHSDNLDEIDSQLINLFEDRTEEEKCQRGQIDQLKIDQNEEFLVVVFQHMYVDVYDIRKTAHPKKIYEVGPLDGTQIFVDEYCTYMCVLGESRKRIDYYLFEWNYNIEKMAKPVNQFGLSRQATLDRNLANKIRSKKGSKSTGNLNQGEDDEEGRGLISRFTSGFNFGKKRNSAEGEKKENEDGGEFQEPEEQKSQVCEIF